MKNNVDFSKLKSAVFICDCLSSSFFWPKIPNMKTGEVIGQNTYGQRFAKGPCHLLCHGMHNIGFCTAIQPKTNLDVVLKCCNY